MPSDADRFHFQGFADLAQGRCWIFHCERPETPSEIPRLWIDEFPDDEAVWHLQRSGRLYVQVDDLPLIIRHLEALLAVYCEAAAQDAEQPSPRPNWGKIAPTSDGSAPSPADASEL